MCRGYARPMLRLGASSQISTRRNVYFSALAILALTSGCGRLGFQQHPREDIDADVRDASATDLALRDMASDTAADFGVDAAAVDDMAVDAALDAGLDGGVDMSDVDMGIVRGSVSVTPTSGLTTSESGMTDSFTVVLSMEPSSDVLIGLSSSDLLEARVSPATLTFTSANWASPQTVTVSGVIDLIADGNKPFTIVVDPCVTSDPVFMDVDGDDVTGTNLDDATPGIHATPVTGLTTTEAGGTATFTLELQSQPTTSVAIPLSSSDTTEGVVEPAMATFDSTNWNIPQLITVTGVDDARHDGDVAYQIDVGPATGDADYIGLSVAPVAVTNVDDDRIGFAAVATTGLTGENGTNDTVLVTLSSQPTASVTVVVTSTDFTEGTVSPGVLSFTPLNWNTPRTVTVSGVNDALSDGNIAYDVTLAIMATADAEYAALAPSVVPYVNADDDTAAVTVVPTTGLTTTEGGGTATFTISLNTQPASDVEIALTSDALSEGTVLPDTIRFTSTRYTNQVVTVTGVNDFAADGTRVYHVVTAPAVSADPSYDGLDGSDVTVNNLDDDSVGFVITPTLGLATSESGAAATFSVNLASQPSADVSISLASSDLSEGTIAVSSLTFTNLNWSTPQNVTVTGVNDTLVDGNVAYSIITGAATSTDMGYSGVDPTDVLLTNADNDMASVVVTPTSGLTTTEAGGTATFTLVLAAGPSSDVTIDLVSSDLTEGTVAPASVTFTSLNWSVPQTVVVTGVDDATSDGNVAYTIITSAATSSDPNYNGLGVANVSATNSDNEMAGIAVNPTSVIAPEGGPAGTFTVVLNSAPSSDVTVPVRINNAAQGSVSPASVTFTTGNWNVPQIVTVSAVDDAVVDGNVSNSVITDPAVSTTPAYSALNAADVSVTHPDNDTASVVVTPTSGLLTTESGGTATFALALSSQPTSTVSIFVSSSNTNEGLVAPTLVAFTAMNWSTPQTVTVTGVDDTATPLDDGDVAYAINTSAASSADAAYNGLAVANVSVTNQDNDSAGIIVTPIGSPVTSENRGYARFSLRLATNPTASVLVTLATTDSTEGSCVYSGVWLPNGNLFTPVIVTVNGADDLLVDGPVDYGITMTVTSADPAYNGLVVPNYALTNQDNDAADVVVSPSADLVVTERALTKTFQIVLARAPSANVTVNVTSSDLTEATVSPASVTFTTGNWGTARSVVITGVADGTLDGDQPFDILVGAVTSTDVSFAGQDPPDVHGVNVDYETQRCLDCGGLYVPSGAGQTVSSDGAISATGRYAVFFSNAALVGADTNGYGDIYVRDRQTGTAQLISVTSTGANANHGSSRAGMSADARYVAFDSYASNLVPGDTNGAYDVFLRDTVGGTTTRVSVSSAGAQSASLSYGPDVSNDGRYISFSSHAADLVAGDTNASGDIFVRDVVMGTTIRASVTNTGGEIAYNSYGGSMSDDGRYIVFYTTIALAPIDTNGYSDIYIRDLQMNTTSLVSFNSASTGTGNQQAWDPIISHDGRFVSFLSRASNLVSGDTNGTDDAFVRDLQLGTTTLVSLTSTGLPVNASVKTVSAADGGNRFVFTTAASNVVPDDVNGVSDVFVRDISMGATFMVSRSPSGAPGNNVSDGYVSQAPSISNDGHWVVFNTLASNIMYETWDTTLTSTVYAAYVP